ncbi:septation ring formation regulator EzrA [Oceanobacillus halophilus]|uniref:Septation ring formation regulator EzrA n=1 Tax=Oceanobacillus halophilus TaxID=930130 RepID=A0A494ZX33_9BACI|nr:septation ring formation regulator EzrA [Oceanobacillus halophilus]RKQ30548.1 septation ring formation regulator EzrA [Oceanobacillus halophilus]
MAYIIGIILFVIVLLIIGLLLRKRIYDTVDRLENWKLDIMSRNIAAQLSKIKNLNLSGETQDRFETWKERWEQIVTKELPDIEEHLFDAEEAADRFRVSKAKKVLANTENILESIEKDIEEMLVGLDELLESEEMSRKEVEELEPGIKELRKKLSKNRYQYGKAELHFDVEIDHLEEAFVNYHELVENGNYFEARELVIKIKHDKEELEDLIEKFPSLFKKCKHDIPTQLSNLAAGIKEMKEQGFRVEHLGFEKEIHTYQGKLLDLMQQLEKGETMETKQFLDEVEERINEMYHLLEKEAVAKNYLESKVPSFQHSLENMSEKFRLTQSDVEELKKAYYFEDSDMEKYLKLEKSISVLEDTLNDITAEMTNKDVGHSELREQLEAGYIKLEELDKNLDEFKETIKNLRKDELDARDKLAEMRSQLYNLNRKLKKSNIPGVPNFIWNSIETTTNKNSQVIAALEKTPLDMVAVQEALLASREALDSTVQQTDLMLEQAYLTEQVIQYANRYRSKYPILAAKLAESERLFRSYEYELALETAAKAIEEIEPGALKKIEDTQAVIHS